LRSAHGNDLRIDVVLAILALQDARGQGETFDDPEQHQLVAVGADPFDGLARFAVNGDVLLVDDG
jgi:hypothetical protein